MSQNATVTPSNLDDYPYGKKWAYFVLFLLFMLMMSNFLDRRVIIPLFPAIKAEFGLSDAQLGILGGAVNFTLPLLVFPVAYFLDRYSRKKLVGAMAAIWTACTLLCSLSTGFWSLFLYRLGVGVGESGYGPGSTAITADYVPKSKLSSALGFINSGASFGVVIAILAGGFITPRLGWKAAFALVALPGILFTILIFFIKERTNLPTAGANAAPARVPMIPFLKKMLTCPTMLLLFMANAAFILFQAGVNTWNTTLFVRVHQLPLEKASVLAAGLVVLSGVSTLLGGVVVDRLRRRFPKAPMICCAFFAFWTGLFYVWGFFFAPVDKQIMAIFIASLTVGGTTGPMMAAIVEISPSAAKASATSLMIIVQNIFGLAFGPILIGLLSDHMGLEASIGSLSLLCLISGVFYLLCSLFYARDKERAEIL